MDEVFFVVFFFVVLIPLVLSVIVPVYKKSIKATEGIVNHDNYMRSFVYKTYLSREEIIKSLQIVNSADELKCEVDCDTSMLLFSEYGASIRYRFEVRQVDGFYIIKIEQIPYVATQGHIPIKLNSFIIQKLSAQPVPFAEYGV